MRDRSVVGRSYYDAVDDADVDAIAALVSSDHGHRWGVGSDSEDEDVIATEDRLVIRWIASGTQTGDLNGVALCGVPASWPGITIFTVECGELVEGWTEADHLTRLQAMGVITSDELQAVATPEA